MSKPCPPHIRPNTYEGTGDGALDEGEEGAAEAEKERKEGRQ